jgi:hypothetical protein
VRRESCGDVFEPENADALVKGLLALRRDTARMAHYRQACLAGASNYDRRILGLRLLDILERVAHHGR